MYFMTTVHKQSCVCVCVCDIFMRVSLTSSLSLSLSHTLSLSQCISWSQYIKTLILTTMMITYYIHIMYCHLSSFANWSNFIKESVCVCDLHEGLSHFLSLSLSSLSLSLTHTHTHTYTLTQKLCNPPLLKVTISHVYCIHTHTYNNMHIHRINMASCCIQHLTLEVNCGFACCAIRELTPKTNGHRQIDTQQRATEFQQLFSECSNYMHGIDENYFCDDGKNGSHFYRDCTKILQTFKKKWHPKEMRPKMGKPFQLQPGKLSHLRESRRTPYLSARPATSNFSNSNWHILKDHTTKSPSSSRTILRRVHSVSWHWKPSLSQTKKGNSSGSSRDQHYFHQHLQFQLLRTSCETWKGVRKKANSTRKEKKSSDPYTDSVGIKRMKCSKRQQLLQSLPRMNHKELTNARGNASTLRRHLLPRSPR